MKNTLRNFTAKNGAIIGGAYIISFLLFYLMHGKLHTQNDMSGNLNLLFLVAGIIMFTRKFRADNKLEFMSYGTAFNVGFNLSFFAAIVGGFFLYVFYKFISPESVIQAQILQQNTLLQGGYTEDEVSAMNKLMRGFQGPGFMAFSSFFGNVIFGAIISLITAVFLKKGTQDPNAFNKDMSKIDNE